MTTPLTLRGWLVCGGAAAARQAVALSARPLPETLAAGSLALEIALPRGGNAAHPILHHAARAGETRMFTLHLTIDGRLVLTQVQGGARRVLSLDLGTAAEEGGLLRVIYSWDAQTALLTAEMPEAGLIRQRAGTDPLPLSHDDIMALLTPRAQGQGLDWLAFGDHRQPVGPSACFAPSTPIDTPEGPRSAGNIRAGDKVITEKKGAQPVLWSGQVTWPALGSFAPVRLSAQTFGTSRDLWLLPAHRICVSGTAVQYHFDEDEILVEARHLVDGASATRMCAPKVLTWQGIYLQQHHILFADGCKLESLYSGGLALSPELCATTALRDIAADISPQKPCSLRELSRTEATTLISARAQALGPVAA